MKACNIEIDVFQHLYWEIPLNKWVSVTDIRKGTFTGNLSPKQIREALKTLHDKEIVEMKGNKVRIRQEINERTDTNIERNIVSELRGIDHARI